MTCFWSFLVGRRTSSKDSPDWGRMLASTFSSDLLLSASAKPLQIVHGSIVRINHPAAGIRRKQISSRQRNRTNLLAFPIRAINGEFDNDIIGLFGVGFACFNKLNRRQKFSFRKSDIIFEFFEH